MGASYVETGRFEEAVSAYKQALLRNPDNIFPHIGLASTYILMGREKEGRTEAVEVLRINPKLSLDNYAKAVASFFPDQLVLDSHIGRLSKQG